jgi:hypothetical protein
MAEPTLSSAQTSDFAAIRAVAQVSLFAAKDRTFKTVRPNQGTASGTVPIRRRPSL